MDIQIKFKALAEKIEQMKDGIASEEATKTAFVLPFINILGYDIFDPTEVVPEFTADMGIKKGEKVDYAIMQGGKPILIMECKPCYEKLDLHDSQLYRYFATTKCRFAILTNGIEYRIYTDLEDANVMDSKPFITFNMTDMKENILTEIKKFQKDTFNIDSIIGSASTLKYVSNIKSFLAEEMLSPSDDFVRLFASKVYSGKLTTKVIEEFRGFVNKATAQTISERVNERLSNAISKEVSEQKSETEIEETVKVVTTMDETEGFMIVKVILRRILPSERISDRDTQSYFGVLLDDNNRKPICRLHFNNDKKYIGLFDADKNETKYVVETVDDIYKFETEILTTAKSYEVE